MNNLYLPLERYTLPTADEMLVNEKILGQCAHRRTSLRRNQFEEWESLCVDCGERRAFCGFREPRPTREAETELWLRGQLRPARGVINSLVVRYALQRLGWSISYAGRNGLTVCTLKRGERLVKSEPQATEPAALVNAAARLAKKGLDTRV